MRLRRPRSVAVALALIGLATGSAVAADAMDGPAVVEGRARAGEASVPAAPLAASLADGATHHYLYVFPDQAMYVYDIDHGHQLVQQVSLPGVAGVRGVAASPRTHTLYISYGGDSGTASHGSVIAYDLLTGAVRWRRTYDRGIDSLAIDRTGSVLYVPDGELSNDGVWNVIDAQSGAVLGEMQGGSGPHNTVVGLSGRRVYLGGRNASYLDVASTVTGRIVKRIGPLRPGVRPFTVTNGAGRLAFTTATGALGFQVSSIATGRVLYTDGFGPHFGYDPATFSPSAPSHGISLSPDERELWVIDAPNDYVHVFDVAGLPGRAPRRVADIRLDHVLTGSEAGCSYDCARDGWLLHSRSGCYVYVGDSGEAISTVTRREVAFLPALRDTRKYLEIDWRAGAPVATTGRQGLGYVRHGPPAAPPRCR